MDQLGKKTDFYEIRKEYPAEFRETVESYLKYDLVQLGTVI